MKLEDVDTSNRERPPLDVPAQQKAVPCRSNVRLRCWWTEKIEPCVAWFIYTSPNYVLSYYKHAVHVCIDTIMDITAANLCYQTTPN